MSSKYKFGVIGLALAIAAFGAFAGTHGPTSVKAHPIGITSPNSGNPQIQVGTSVNVTFNFLDDEQETTPLTVGSACPLTAGQQNCVTIGATGGANTTAHVTAVGGTVNSVPINAAAVVAGGVNATLPQPVACTDLAAATCIAVINDEALDVNASVDPVAFVLTIQCDTAATALVPGSYGFVLGQGGAAIAAANVFTCSNVAANIATFVATGTAIGGSTPNLTNSTNVEIYPALGSDNDARIDIRVTGGLNNATNVPGAHVTWLVDNGLIATRVGAGTPVIVPDQTNLFLPYCTPTSPCTTGLGSTTTGDTCEAPFFDPNNPRVADGVTDGFGDMSACFLANSASVGAIPIATPGKATITIIVDVPGFTALVRTVTITIVGPVASITVAASPTSLRCGEKSTITATAKDSTGQNVSDHTRVELVTNLGGVLGGTGAVVNFSGPSVPISSTVAETFAGVATAFLVTSESHSGPYEVVVTAGGSTSLFNLGTSIGVAPLSIAPISAQVTVTCNIPAPTAAAPAAAVTAPRTGEGTSITPPRTGDAGLADSSSSSGWALFVIGGMAAFTLAGLATYKFARR